MSDTTQAAVPAGDAAAGAGDIAAPDAGAPVEGAAEAAGDAPPAAIGAGAATQFIGLFRRPDIGLALGIVAILVMLILPMPTYPVRLLFCPWGLPKPTGLTYR